MGHKNKQVFAKFARLHYTHWYYKLCSQFARYLPKKQL